MDRRHGMDRDPRWCARAAPPRKARGRVPRRSTDTPRRSGTASRQALAEGTGRLACGIGLLASGTRPPGGPRSPRSTAATGRPAGAVSPSDGVARIEWCSASPPGSWVEKIAAGHPQSRIHELLPGTSSRGPARGRRCLSRISRYIRAVLGLQRTATCSSIHRRARSPTVGPPPGPASRGSAAGSSPALMRAMISAARLRASSAVTTPWRPTVTRFAAFPAARVCTM